MHPQKPFADAGLDIVNSIAGDMLLHLSQEKLIIFYQHRPESRKRLRVLTQMSDDMSEAVPRNLRYDMIERHLVIESLASPESAILADHAGLDCTSADQFDHARDDPGMRKIDLLNPLMRFGQNLLSMQIDNGKLRLDPIEHVRFK